MADESAFDFAAVEPSVLGPHLAESSRFLATMLSVGIVARPGAQSAQGGNTVSRYRLAGMITLVAALLLATYGLGVNPAAAAPPVKVDPDAGVTQNWDKVLPAAQRFTVLEAFNNEAVRDN
jgi:hypothetical protein